MDETKPDPAKDRAHERSTVIAPLLSGALFGTIGAAAANWLGNHAIPRDPGGKPGFGTRALTIVVGLFGAVVAFYSARRAQDAPPRSVYAETPAPVKHETQHAERTHEPVAKIAAADAEIDGALARQDRNLGL